MEKTSSENPNGLGLQHFQNDAAKNKSILLKDLLIDEINDASNIGDPIPVVLIDNCVFAVRGDISLIGGLPKAGKTSTVPYMVITALKKDLPEDFDSLKIRSTYCEGKNVIYIDTEQPQAYTNKLRLQIKKLLGLSSSDQQPSNLKILNLRKYDYKTKLEKVLALMDAFPDTHLWIIDGLADLIRDPNDTRESFGIIETFMMRSDQMKTAIILFIHENPGTSGKLRGNLGSEAERKCGGSISVKKIREKGIHAIEAKLIRGAKDFEPIYFCYDIAVGRFRSLDVAESNDIKKLVDKQQIKFDQRLALAKKCLEDTNEPKSYADLRTSLIKHSALIEGKNFKERTAESRIKELNDLGIIVQNGDQYVLEDKYITQS